MKLAGVCFANVHYKFTTKKCRIKNYLSFRVFERLSIVGVDCLTLHYKGIAGSLPSDLIIMSLSFESVNQLFFAESGMNIAVSIKIPNMTGIATQ